MQLPKYESYKDSGVEWLGEIPAHWNCDSLRSATLLKSDKNRPDLQVLSVYREYGVIIKDSRDDNHNTTSLDTSTYKVVQPGDLVINKMKAWQGSMGVSEYEGVVSPAYITCKTNHDDFHPKYLHYLLRSKDYVGVYNSISYGVRIGQWDLRYEDFKKVVIPIPLIEEQKRIASFLDQKTAEIDEAIAKKQKLIELLQEQKSILINQAVTKGLNPDAPMKESGVEWIGEIPAHWEVKRLKHITSKIYDCKNRTPSPSDKHEYFVIRTSNVKSGKLITQDAEWTTEKDFIEWTRKGKPLPGELVFTREAPAGEVAMVPEGYEMCLGQRMMGIKHDEDVALPEYLLYFLQSNAMKEYVELMSAGSTVPHLRVGQVHNIPVSFPQDTSEQSAICKSCSEHSLKIDEVQLSIEKEILTLQELRQSLISSAVTGKIKV